MAKFKKIIVAGPLVVETVYPAPNPRDTVGVRAGKKRLSSEAQQRMNLKYAWQKLELEIAANFGVKDLFVCLTYDDDHLPATRKEAQEKIRAFWKRLRRVRAKQKKELRYLYVTENKHTAGRWHHHALINATGMDYAMIRELWGQGGVELTQIRLDGEKTYESLARYLCKEQREKVGQRLWSGSLNLRKPDKDCFRVTDDTTVEAPDGAEVLIQAETKTEYAHFKYIKYLAGGWPMAKVHAKRNRPHKRV